MFAYVLIALIGGGIATTLWGPAAGVFAAVALVAIAALYERTQT